MYIHEFSSHNCQKTAKKEGMILQKESSVNFGVDDTIAKAAEFRFSVVVEILLRHCPPHCWAGGAKTVECHLCQAWFHLVSFHLVGPHPKHQHMDSQSFGCTAKSHLGDDNKLKSAEEQSTRIITQG